MSQRASLIHVLLLVKQKKKKKKTNKICVVIEKRNSIHMWMGRWKKKHSVSSLMIFIALLSRRMPPEKAVSILEDS